MEAEKVYKIGGFALYPANVDECETCHKMRPGRWLDTDDGSCEWFTCWKCQPPTDDETREL